MSRKDYDADAARAIVAEINTTAEDGDEFTDAYLVAGLISSQLAIVAAIDHLSQTIIDKFAEPETSRDVLAHFKQWRADVAASDARVAEQRRRDDEL